MDYRNDDQDQDDFQKRIAFQEGEEEKKEEQPSSESYYVTRPRASYYYKEKKTPYVTIVVVALIAGMLGSILGAYIGPRYLYGKYVPYPQTDGVGQQQIEIVTKGEELNVIPAVAKKAMPSVVGITTITVQRDLFFGARKGQGVGTGVIVDSRGYILTNSHVVNDGRSEEVNVLLYDGDTTKAEVLWNDPTLDLAVLKVTAENLKAATLGDSDKIVVGETAVAIGNPLGLTFERTVTSGIISGLERSIPLSEFESIEGLIQTDASINPGNSGGPLLNTKGEVIGINTAKIQTGEGLGFAVPINIAKPIVDEFIEKGEFTKVQLGIRGIGVTQYIASYGNNLGTEKGAFIYEIVENSPASRAGLKAGDVITSIDDEKIDTMGQLVRQLYQYRPGDRVVLEIVREKKRMTLEATLESTSQR
ncbi:S1-C subfamily serine protease [Anaerosolibacter carboniphilus]|uniref:S1-C subfamily serine protease n=1 Tax=Anaerosolibacter carboniphilus TaxID=1417629 RepID=A0A841KKZ2_9FIRM|nr:trypsin-like peptidase domain-containing protein [Anaerosolibacter carboniphilus]MBB6214524.1 S1-C subfamily serine protease [Anaerosolibacter carboniphilus]